MRELDNSTSEEDMEAFERRKLLLEDVKYTENKRSISRPY